MQELCDIRLECLPLMMRVSFVRIFRLSDLILDDSDLLLSLVRILQILLLLRFFGAAWPSGWSAPN